jgi:hypothetical protein
VPGLREAEGLRIAETFQRTLDRLLREAREECFRKFLYGK